MSYINEFMNFLIFHNFSDFILIFQDLVKSRNWTVGIKSRTWMVKIQSRNRRVGIKSRNWMVKIQSRNRTVAIKSCDWTAEITQSGIRVMGHDPTNFTRSDG